MTHAKLFDIASHISKLGVHGAGAAVQFARDLADGYLALSARLAEVEQELVKWRDWAQFVFKNGGPISGTDTELRQAVCNLYDRDIAKANVERGEIVKACPRCGNQESISDFAGQWMCQACGRGFAELAYWQRVQGPT